MWDGTRHNDRDEKLKGTLHTLMTAVEADLVKDENVHAVFYGGSVAKGNYDNYSDLDLRIVVKDDVYEEYRLRKKERAAHWGDVLFYEDFPWTTHSVAHFKNFLKVDTFYYKPSDLRPFLYMKSIKVVHDPYGLVRKIVEQSQLLNYKVTLEEFEIWRGKFFAHLHEVYRRVMRGEFYYALSSLNIMRWSVTAGWDMENDRLPNASGDWSKVEGKRSELWAGQLDLLGCWDCDRNSANIMRVAESVTQEFKKVHSHLCVKLEIAEDTERVEEIIGLVL